MKPFRLIILFALLTSFFTLFGCLESNIQVPPFSTGQFVSRATDLNYANWKNSDYNNMVLVFKNDKISVADANDLNVALPDLSGFVPYQGATSDVNLNRQDLLNANFIEVKTDRTLSTSGTSFDYAQFKRNDTLGIGLRNYLNGTNNEPMFFGAGGHSGGTAILFGNTNGFLRVLPFDNNTVYFQSSLDNFAFSGLNGTKGTGLNFNYGASTFQGTVSATNIAATNVSVTTDLKINTSLRFADSNGNNKWHLQRFNDRLTIVETGVAERFVIKESTGNVGVGNNNPKVTLDVSGKGRYTQDLNVEGTIYYNALEAMSPHALLADESGYTRICTVATNGDVVYETTQLVSGEYKKVIVKDTTGVCDKTVLKNRYETQDLMLVGGQPTFVAEITNVYQNIWTKETNEEIIREIRESISDWNSGVNYYVGNYFNYNGVAYEVLQEHVSQEDWLPNQLPTLYKVLVLHEYNEVSEWVQPTGSSDCYPLNALVTYQGKTYKNTGSNCNVWNPLVYGWVLQ
jgi:hypothetical protein